MSSVSPSDVDGKTDNENGDLVEMAEPSPVAETDTLPQAALLPDPKLRKRRLTHVDSDSDEASVKKFITTNDYNSSPSPEQSEVNLLDFSDEILLEIFTYCGTDTLRALTKTCTRFERLCYDRRLWTNFDLSKIRLRAREITKWLKYALKDTKSFSIRGMVSKYPLDVWKNNTITSNILSQLSNKCPKLEALTIHEGYLNYQKIKISEFPHSLKRLVFNSCQSAQSNPANVFHKIDYHLEHLEELSLEKCPWFQTHDLIVFSKLPNLKKLNLRGCSSLKECVPYGSIATRFGFRKLQSLDIRGTPVSDSDIQCFNITSTLREFLMECPEDLRGPARAEIPTSDNKDQCVESVNDLNIIDDLYDNGTDDDDNENMEEQNDDKKKEGEGRSNSGSHVIQVIVQSSGNHGALLDNDYQMREINGIRYMVGVMNGGGPEEVLQRHVEHQRAEQERLERERESQQADASKPKTPSKATTSEQPDSKNKAKETSFAEPSTSKSESVREHTKAKDNDRSSDTKTEAKNSSNTNYQEAGPSKRSIEPSRQEEPQEAVKPQIEEKVQRTENKGANSSDDAAQVNQNVRLNPEPQHNPGRLFIVEHQPRLLIFRRGVNDDNNAPEVENRRDIAEARRRAIQLIIQQRERRLQRQQQRGEHTEDSSTQYQSPVSDRGLCGFGLVRNNVHEGVIWIRAEQRPTDTLIERLTVRHYRSVTDVTLRHLAESAPNLAYLDVTGTSVTLVGLRDFKASKPDCVVISDFDKSKLNV